jgi:ElaB protein
MKQNYRAVSESVDDFVHESPWKAITVAALGGIVIGMLAAR